MAQISRKVSAAPAGFEKQRLFEGTYWHQKWQVFEDVFTPGVNCIEHMCESMGLPNDLTGKRVLDIGAWNGCLSLECERRGALEVVALGPENPNDTAFYRLRDAIGSTRTRYLRGTVYDLDPQKLGTFDVVLFCGVLYHLRYPLLGIDNIRRVCTGEVFVETFLIDQEFILKKDGKLTKVPLSRLSPELSSQPIWQFYRLDELEGDPSNWVGPNSTAVVEAFESAGFETRFLGASPPRGYFRARVKEGAPEFLAIRCGEGVYYDVLVKHLFGNAERSHCWARSA
jgi:tRNA (mo5U34)-methyltransferase